MNHQTGSGHVKLSEDGYEQCLIPRDFHQQFETCSKSNLPVAITPEMRRLLSSTEFLFGPFDRGEALVLCKYF